MRVSVFLVFVCAFQLWSANTEAQNAVIHISAKNISVGALFGEIEKQTDYLVVYKTQEVDVDRKIDIPFESGKVSDYIKAAFDRTDIGYDFENRYIVLARKSVLFPAGENASQQNPGKRITGTVADATGEPVIGANVIEKGTTNGSISDVDGKFTLNVSSGAALVVSYIGYVSQEIAVGNQTHLSITLAEDNQAIDEVVVVGYGTQKKINLTGAIQSVSSSELTRRNASNASVALQGLIPGVSVVQTSGQPGADGATIVVRGTGSINSATGPLVLIDGVSGDMNNIDMNSIESISVLKDAASASIYGSRASNGVILITTKRSKDEKVSISYNGYAGFNTPTELPDPLDAIGFMEGINLARANADQQPQYSQDLINQYKTLGPDNFNRYEANWKGELLKQTALVQNHSVSLSGGSKRINYFANAGYYFQDGQIDHNSYKRMTLRINTDARLTDWLKLGVDVNIRQSKEIRPSQGAPSSLINQAITFSPVFSAINNDGTWGFGQNGHNPIAIVREGGLRDATTPELGVKGFMQLNPFKGFEVLTSYSSRRVEQRISTFVRAYDTYEGGAYKTTNPASGHTRAEAWNQLMVNQFNLQAFYEKTLANHYLKILA
ncbi:MAG: SusC/RagA family TonB-linked outer membrane protein, partial [Tannerella sp.]|nr:SusC/RagA family TonB-linked outer membrane protein [Tannerella sp.]